MAQATTTGPAISRRVASDFYSERLQPIPQLWQAQSLAAGWIGHVVRAAALRSVQHFDIPETWTMALAAVLLSATSLIRPSWCGWCDKWAEYEGRHGERPGFWRYPMGTDTQSRDLFAVNLQGVPLTLGTGLIAGLLSVGVGTIMAFAAAYYRGLPDGVIRLMTDVGISIPGLLVLIIHPHPARLGAELVADRYGTRTSRLGVHRAHSALRRCWCYASSRTSR